MVNPLISDTALLVTKTEGSLSQSLGVDYAFWLTRPNQGLLNF